MIEVVCNPCGEQLPERDPAKLRMPADPIQIGVGQSHVRDRSQVVGPRGPEFIEEAAEGSTRRRLELRVAIELLERP